MAFVLCVSFMHMHMYRHRHLIRGNNIQVWKEMCVEMKTF